MMFTRFLSIFLSSSLLLSNLSSGVESYSLNPNSHNSRFSTALGYKNEGGASTRAPPQRKVKSIQGPQDFLDYLKEDDRLCVVKVYAHWCKTCKVFDTRYRKLASQESDKTDANGNVVKHGRVRFSEIEFTVNEDLCRSLDATILPYIIMYKGGSGFAGKLDEFVCAPSKFQKVIDRVNDFADDYAILELEDESEFQNLMEEGAAFTDELAMDIREEVLANKNVPSSLSGSSVTFEDFSLPQTSPSDSAVSFEDFCLSQKSPAEVHKTGFHP